MVSNILADDRLYDTQNGKGGSIYINPSFGISDSQLQSENMSSSIKIEKCIFKANQGYDGTDIYIAGEDYGTTIKITNNEFINNIEGESNNINSSLILSDICSISRKQILRENTFSNENELNIFSANCTYTPSCLFNESNIFTFSSDFSTSSHFSNSFWFSKSGRFSCSNLFSYSIEFSKTK